MENLKPVTDNLGIKTRVSSPKVKEGEDRPAGWTPGVTHQPQRRPHSEGTALVVRVPLNRLLSSGKLHANLS